MWLCVYIASTSTLSLSLPPSVLSLPPKVALARPVLYSNWLTKDYLPVNQEELRDYVQARLKVFYEEELDVPLVLFDEVLDHVLRIDRIFKQSQVYNSYGLCYLTHTCTCTHTRARTGSPASDWCQWSWQDYSLQIRGLDQRPLSLPSQGQPTTYIHSLQCVHS